MFGIVLVIAAVSGGLSDDDDDGSEVAAPTSSPRPASDEEPISEEEEESVATPTSEPSSTDAEPEPTFAFGPEELEDRWARATDEFGSPRLSLKDFTVDDGGVRTVFQANIAPTVEMLGSVVDGRVAEIMTLSQASADNAENAEVIVSWGLLIATAHPDLSPDERGQVLDELGVNDSSDFVVDGHEASVLRGNVEFSLRFSEVIGWSMVATPAD